MMHINNINLEKISYKKKKNIFTQNLFPMVKDHILNVN